MALIVEKIRGSLERNGLTKTTVKVLNYPVELLKRRYFKNRILSLSSVEDRFTWIYKNNHWSDEESVSGSGSTLKYTENLRAKLPALIKKYSIQSIFDAPCGDFNWMKTVLPNVRVNYIGSDIVASLIESHKNNHSSEKISFVHSNLIKDSFPKVDLMICRDCLFHLSYQDSFQILNNFLESGSSYLLTTTHKNLGQFVNSDISTGDFRLMDLFSTPYNFPKNPLERIDDWLPPDQPREMCLWNREQVQLVVEQYRSY